MKKNSIFRLMVAAMVAVVSVTTFTACGGDDDDDVIVVEPGTVTFVEPCLEFGASKDRVKEYMSNSSWQLEEETVEYVLMYTNSSATTAVTYGFTYNKRGLNKVIVTYITNNSQSIVSEVKRHHNVTLTKDADVTNKAETMYVGQTTIGGRTVAIAVHCTNAITTVFYELPD